MDEQLLREIGLSEYESKIYLALIALGESTSGQIMNKANINSGRIYQILDSLKEKGLISEIVKNKVKYFSPTNPQKILDYIGEKEESLAQKKKSVSEEIPGLLSLMGLNKKQARLQVFTGFEGQKSAFLMESLRYDKSAELTVLGVKEKEFYPKRIMDFFEYNIYPKRNLSKVKVRKINDMQYKKSGYKSEKGSEIRFLEYPSSITINTCKDLSIISIYSDEIITIVVESEDVANSFRMQFEALWKIAKK